MQPPSTGWARAFTKLLGAAQAVCSEDRMRCVRGGRRAPPLYERTTWSRPTPCRARRMPGPQESVGPGPRLPRFHLCEYTAIRRFPSNSKVVRCARSVASASMRRHRGGHQVLASPSSAGSARALLVRVNRKCGFPRWVAARASEKERESHRRHDHTEEASWGDIKCWPRLRAQDRPEPCWFE